MDTFLRILGWLIALLWIPVTAILIVYAITTNVMPLVVSNVATNLSDVEVESVVQEISPAVLDLIVDSTSAQDASDTSTISLSDIRDRLPESRWDLLSQQIVSQSWLQDEVRTTLNAILGLGTGDEPRRLQINVEPIQAQLSGRNGRQIAEDITAYAEACTTEELATLITLVDDEIARQNSIDFVCAPPTNYRDVMVDAVEIGLNDFALGLESGIGNMFQQVDITKTITSAAVSVFGIEDNQLAIPSALGDIVLQLPLEDFSFESFDSAEDEGVFDPKQGVLVDVSETSEDATAPRTTMDWVQLFAVVGGAFLIISLVILILVRTLRSLGVWWGIVAAISGGVLLIAVNGLQNVLNQWLAGAEASSANALSSISRTVTQTALNAVLPALRDPLTIASIILLVVGILLLFVVVGLPRLLPQSVPSSEDPLDEDFVY